MRRTRVRGSGIGDWGKGTREKKQAPTTNKQQTTTNNQPNYEY
ncbi:MAG: hypothetical protein ACR9NN_01550 [Nostochopsis sp.]